MTTVKFNKMCQLFSGRDRVCGGGDKKIVMIILQGKMRITAKVPFEVRDRD